jgi:HAD superfamily hydrolase (TIGR01509 family)
MIKHVIFDLDGVLVDARELHYEAMNRALAEHGITVERDEHLATYDGLPTRQKLQLLTERKGLSVAVHDIVWQAKQEQTQKVIVETIRPNAEILDAVRKVKADGYTVSVCSNSIRQTVEQMLKQVGLLDQIEFFLSNEDVEQSKPHPEMYLRAILKLKAAPAECLVVEDSHHGRQAAEAAGCQLCGVTGPAEVNYARISDAIRTANSRDSQGFTRPKWQGRDMNIVVPMAGAGQLFKQAGYSFPKPLVDILGKPMVQWVVENINVEGRFIFIVRAEDYLKYNLQHLLTLLAPGCEIVQLDEPTSGAALSVLTAEQYINNDSPLTVVNSDQLLEWNSNEFFYAMAADECDGGLVTFESTHPKWSYVKTGANGLVIEAAEKKPISNQATAGVYYFAKGADFIRHTNEMVAQGIHTNGEYYVCPVYNQYIAAGAKIRPFNIKNMCSFATPEDLAFFIQKYQAERIVDKFSQTTVVS